MMSQRITLLRIPKATIGMTVPVAIAVVLLCDAVIIGSITGVELAIAELALTEVEKVLGAAVDEGPLVVTAAGLADLDNASHRLLKVV